MGRVRDSKRLFPKLYLLTIQESIKSLEHLKSCTAQAYQTWPEGVSPTCSHAQLGQICLSLQMRTLTLWTSTLVLSWSELSALPCPKLHHKASYILNYERHLLQSPLFISRNWQREGFFGRAIHLFMNSSIPSPIGSLSNHLLSSTKWKGLVRSCTIYLG